MEENGNPTVPAPPEPESVDDLEAISARLRDLEARNAKLSDECAKRRIKERGLGGTLERVCGKLGVQSIDEFLADGAPDRDRALELEGRVRELSAQTPAALRVAAVAWEALARASVLEPEAAFQKLAAILRPREDGTVETIEGEVVDAAKVAAAIPDAARRSRGGPGSGGRATVAAPRLANPRADEDALDDRRLDSQREFAKMSTEQRRRFYERMVPR